MKPVKYAAFLALSLLFACGAENFPAGELAENGIIKEMDSTSSTTALFGRRKMAAPGVGGGEPGLPPGSGDPDPGSGDPGDPVCNTPPLPQNFTVQRGGSSPSFLDLQWDDVLAGAIETYEIDRRSYGGGVPPVELERGFFVFDETVTAFTDRPPCDSYGDEHSIHDYSIRTCREGCCSDYVPAIPIDQFPRPGNMVICPGIY